MTIDEFIHRYDKDLEPFSGIVPYWCVLQFDTSEHLDCYANRERSLLIFICKSAGGFELHRLLDSSMPKSRLCIGTLDEDKPELEHDDFKP